MSTWKARPTTYRGIQMRSRLEASYAARLDERQVDWEYEPRAFGGRRGQYLPDFVVHETLVGDVYLEIKPTVESAMGVLARMEIVLESIPGAFLICVVPGVGAYQRRPEGWRWYAMEAG